MGSKPLQLMCVSEGANSWKFWNISTSPAKYRATKPRDIPLSCLGSVMWFTFMSSSPAGYRDISAGNSQRAVRRWAASNVLMSQILILTISDLSREIPCTEITIERVFIFVAKATVFPSLLQVSRSEIIGIFPCKHTDTHTHTHTHTRGVQGITHPVKPDLLWNLKIPSALTSDWNVNCFEKIPVRTSELVTAQTGNFFSFRHGWDYFELTTGRVIS
jgi:hypothetical protein